MSQIASTRIGLKPYERIASEKPGEELAPDAAIWEMYVEEAREQDKELVDDKNGNLDQMLLFATLFSAILTAFIIESKNLLQQDSADLTVTLLLAIAQSQQRMEQNTPQTLAPIERPPFSAPISARWINGLWYTSLALSLSAALVAMLAKEWLGSFLSSRPRSPHKYALSRHMKSQGLARWKAVHIIDLLPTLLHFSLLLFSLGLVTYLWTLDSGAAIAVAIVTTTTALFYLVTAVLGATRTNCPFDTQVSKYIHAILAQLSTGASPALVKPPDAKAEDSTTDDELHALMWLAENARDPIIGDCAYQALAGLRVPEVLAVASNSSPSVDPGPETLGPTQSKLNYLTSTIRSKRQRKSDDSFPPPPVRYTVLNSLCEAICTRLEQAITYQPRNVTACLGSNLAQYAGALPMLVRSLETYMRMIPNVNDNNQSQRLEVSKSPGQSALIALDSVWSDDCPELHPNSYAMLIGAELRVLEAVMLAYHPRDTPTIEHKTREVAEAFDPPPKHSSIPVDYLPNNQLVINTEPTQEIARMKKTSQFELRARYSRTLFRAGLCLRFHNDGRILINSYLLEYLLNSLRIVTRCPELNPESCLSTHHPQSEDTSELPDFNLYVIRTGLSQYLPPMFIGDIDGLLSGLVGVLSAADIESLPWIEYSAGQTLWAVGPMLLRQWLQTRDDELKRYFLEQPQVLECVETALKSWPLPLEPGMLSSLTFWTLTQLLIITSVMVALADCPSGDTLARIATSALYRRATMASGRGPLVLTIANRSWLVGYLIRFMDAKSQDLGQATLGLLLQLFLVRSPVSKEPDAFSKRSVPVNSLACFLNCLCKWPGHAVEVQKILAELQEMIRVEELDISTDFQRAKDCYVWVFTRHSEGFSSLARLAQVPEYTLITINFVKTFVHNILTADLPFDEEQGDPILACIVPGLLNCASIVLKSTAQDSENLPHTLTFVLEVVTLLDTVVGEWSVAENHPAIDDIRELLAKPHEATVEIPDTTAGLAKVRAWIDRSPEQNEPGKHKMSFAFRAKSNLSLVDTDLPDIFQIRIDDDTSKEEVEN
ncbi:hypothetical protein FRC09_006769 [Ceratobasidium sp. 395]|nr:hypothetical protein FRC09_006769 [Ceratobasidium sp. 395]